MRHAKSSWDEPFNSDLERGLKKRGYEDILLISKELRKRGVKANLIISSPAKRALITAEIAAAFLRYEIEDIKVDKRLYFEGTNKILQTIKEVDNKIDSLIIVGHNPDFTEFINSYSNLTIDNLPTSGVVKLEFKGDWSSFKKGKSSLFLYPKLLR